MASRVDCIGTFSGPCPSGVSWERTRALGAPRKRCRVCSDREHLERSHLDRLVVNEGVAEQDAVVAMLLHLARAAIRSGRHNEGMRLTQRAMAALAPLLRPDPRREHAALGTEHDHGRRAAPAPARRAPSTPNVREAP